MQRRGCWAGAESASPQSSLWAESSSEARPCCSVDARCSVTLSCVLRPDSGLFYGKGRAGVPPAGQASVALGSVPPTSLHLAGVRSS